MYIMETNQITLEQLYSFLQQKFKEIEYRLDLHEKHFEYLEKQSTSSFKVLSERMDNLEKMTKELYDKREKISMEFNRKVLFGNSFIAGVVSFVVAMFTGKYQAHY